MLADNEPSYEKFLSLGFLIKKTNERTKMVWKNIKKSNYKLSYKVMAVYIAYSEKILQDSDKVARLKNLVLTTGLRAEGNILMRHATNGDAVIGVCATKQDIGKITLCNSALSELTGYLKEELNQFPLENLMPQMYREMHYKEFARVCFDSQFDINTKYEQKNVFLLHKSGYILPVIIRIVASPNISNEFNFIARIIKDKSCNSHSVVHILTDLNHNITDITSSKII